MFSTCELSGGYGGRTIIRGVSIAVAQGETVAVLGANTAGKTTLIRAIAGLLPVVTGQIMFAAEDISRLAANRRVAKGIALVPEGRHVFPQMSVKENLLMGAYHRRREVISGELETCFSLFPRLRERRGQHAATLSGGEQQMVALGRALMAKPRLLLLDEPSHGLAPLLVAEVHDAIARINALGISVLLIEQAVAGALRLVARAYVMEGGRIVLTGSSAELSANDAVRRTYLGV
jgi:branched-chain amino acid transport system ATP-binding protein